MILHSFKRQRHGFEFAVMEILVLKAKFGYFRVLHGSQRLI